MSVNIIPISPPSQNEIPSSQGMTTKVVKGSLWTLGGTIFPFAFTFFATPFIIRFLGSEGYGVLLLVGLIPNYFVFADFGMGVASTKFGSEAYAQGEKQKEGEIVRTAALLALIVSLPIAFILFFFSPLIITTLKVPEYWQSAGNTGLKITSIVFVFGILAGIFNTPQLSRLRMDLNTLVNTISKIILPLGTIIVLYLGGGIVWATGVSLFSILVGLIGHIFLSGKLLPELYQLSIDRKLIKPMLKFGSGLMLASIAVTTSANLEKFALTSLVSVQSLAFYSVAFTFANMTTIFSGAMIQSLVPAFSQLLDPEEKSKFESIFLRSVRFNLIWLFPTIMFLFVIAKPFFTIWGNEEFGKESSVPFYFLLIGVFFQTIAYTPHSAITAFGRTDVLAKLYWAELILGIPLTIFAVNSFGIKGAAIVWSFRAAVDALSIIWLSKHFTQISFGFFNWLGNIFLIILILIPPILFVIFYDNFSLWLISLTLLSLIVYSVFVWYFFIDQNEKDWFRNKLANLIKLKF